MSDKMQVIFVKHTSHVLAAFTRTADPEGKPPIEELVRDGFPVRNYSTVPAPLSGAELLIVPPTKLNENKEVVGAIDAAVVDFNESVFVSPTSFAVSGQTTSLLSKVTITLTLNLNLLTVDLPSPTPNDLKVWAQLAKVVTATEPDVDTRVIERKIEKNQRSVGLSLTVEPNGPAIPIQAGKSYYVMVLVEGMRPVFATRGSST